MHALDASHEKQISYSNYRMIKAINRIRMPSFGLPLYLRHTINYVIH